MLGKLGTEKKTKFVVFCGKSYSSHRTSGFGNPLVQDKRILLSEGQTGGSFLPCI